MQARSPWGARCARAPGLLVGVVDPGSDGRFSRRTVDAGRGHGRRECFDQSEAEREAHSACSVQRVLVDGHCRHSGRVTEEGVMNERLAETTVRRRARRHPRWNTGSLCVRSRYSLLRTGSWDKLRCMHAFSVSTGTREGGREGGRLVAGGATRLSFGSVRAAGFWA